MPMVQVDMFEDTRMFVAVPSPQANLEERVRVLEVRLDAIVAAQYAAAVKPDHEPWIGDIVDSLPVTCFERNPIEHEHDPWTGYNVHITLADSTNPTSDR